ncbi:hypothetical protein BV20DRAFT_458239 [Pilatotrama ljubarskyi]|nr:hypothetical protein BV20DRAFT_458239 [Pilatotrama ljubarskyi]
MRLVVLLHYSSRGFCHLIVVVDSAPRLQESDMRSTSSTVAWLHEGVNRNHVRGRLVRLRLRTNFAPIWEGPNHSKFAASAYLLRPRFLPARQGHKRPAARSNVSGDRFLQQGGKR